MKYILANTFSHLIFKGLEKVEFTAHFPRWSTASSMNVQIAMSTYDCGQASDCPTWKMAEVMAHLPKAQVLLASPFRTLTLGEAKTS